MASDAQVSTATSPRAALARAAAAIAMGVGVFGVVVAWGGVASTVPGAPHLERARYTTTWVEGDAGVAVAALVAAVLPWFVSRVRHGWRVAVASWATSAAVGAVVGAAVTYITPMALWRLTAWGAVMCLGLATARSVCGLPLAWTLGRGAPLASRDALDRVMLGASLWLLAATTEAALVVRIARPAYVETAAPALGVAFFGMTLLAGLSALAALARSARWLALWGRVARGGGWRIVAASSWAGAAPAEAWFEGLGASEGVAARTVAREGAAYREGEVEVAEGRVPLDAARVRRGLALRALAAAGLLAATAAVTAVLVAPLRW
ncbi:MAG: hypothetical protein U0324_19120 [Polyangiales bacterium]